MKLAMLMAFLAGLATSYLLAWGCGHELLPAHPDAPRSEYCSVVGGDAMIVLLILGGPLLLRIGVGSMGVNRRGVLWGATTALVLVEASLVLVMALLSPTGSP